MANRISTFWLPCIGMALWPAVAVANAGTPLMWARGIHLFIGNLAIGIGEGCLLAILFRKRAAPCIGVMIAANYFSAWIGGALLTPKLSDSLGLDLNNAWRWLWIMVVAAYFLTVLLEWPFVAFCLRGSSGWLRKSIGGSLVVQTASYLVIFGWYWAASGTSLYREVAIVPAAEIHVPKGTVLYFIAHDDGDVYALDLSQEAPRKVHELGSRSWYDRLQVTKSDADSGHWDLDREIGYGPERADPENGSARFRRSRPRADGTEWLRGLVQYRRRSPAGHSRKERLEVSVWILGLRRAERRKRQRREAIASVPRNAVSRMVHSQRDPTSRRSGGVPTWPGPDLHP